MGVTVERVKRGELWYATSDRGLACCRALVVSVGVGPLVTVLSISLDKMLCLMFVLFKFVPTDSGKTGPAVVFRLAVAHRSDDFDRID